jgi:hypothetical protein
VLAGAMNTVAITRPRHPLQGRRPTVLGRMHRHGRLELVLVLSDGSKSLIPSVPIFVELEWQSPI